MEEGAETAETGAGLWEDDSGRRIRLDEGYYGTDEIYFSIGGSGNYSCFSYTWKFVAGCWKLLILGMVLRAICEIFFARFVSGGRNGLRSLSIFLVLFCNELLM